MLSKYFLSSIQVNKNGDIDMKSMLTEWQGNYDINWWPRGLERNCDKYPNILSDVDKTPCPSLSELQLHKSKSQKKGVLYILNYHFLTYLLCF